ncbi:MDR family MFS transporter [Clostridium tagluense]|uniref:MDR family MFS transporter n=1 Tax=Clostridium tagluense TaxID=360422 RepID=UPI001CF48941|nr:MDR family MFS transporter [Clostridium tagluense]MCB2299175.1 DHA2 family efflux MFS transporter permease subunit [Clostridium tagluense]
MELKKNNFEQDKKYNVKAMMAVLLFGGFLSLFNETLLNVAFPSLMAEMHVTATTIQWLATGYVLVVGILIPITAFLIHSFNTKPLFLSAMILFLVGTILAVFSTSFPALLISRMIQATGTGMLIPIMMNTALVINPPEKRGSAMGLCVCAILVGPALGPIVSGTILHFLNWQFLFIMLIPLSLISIITGAMFLENVSVITKPKIDYLSIALSTIGFAGTIYGISSINDSNGNNLTIIISFAFGIIALIFFTKRQLSLKQPMLELRVFKQPIFTLCITLLIIAQMIQFSMNMLLPLVLQNGLNTSSLTAALVLLPAAVIDCLVTPIAGKIFDRFGGKVLIPVGLFIICIFMWLLSHIGVSTSIKTIAILYSFVCLGVALSLSPSQTNALNQLSSGQQADGVAITNTAIQLAAAIGSTLFVGLTTAGQNNFLNNISSGNTAEFKVQALYSGFRYSTKAAVIVIVIGFILSLFLRRDVKNQGN